MHLNIRTRQKIKYRIIIAWGLGTVLIISGFILFFNFWNPENVRANQGEIIQVEEQIFTTEMALPGPEIKSSHAPSSNAILVQPIKHTPPTTRFANEK
jgi:hypothetical protein